MNVPTIKPISFLILSDIHFGSDADSNDFAVTPLPNEMSNAMSMKQSLINTLKNENLDGILVCGDLTSKGLPTEFAKCKEAINGIAEELKIHTENIFFTFGNHDVNWDISSLKDRHKDDLFLEVAASVGGLFIKNKIENPKMVGPVVGTGVCERSHFNVYIANSSLYSIHDQKYQHGKLGSVQFEWLKQQLEKTKDESKWHIFLMHHHLVNHPYPFPTEDVSCVEEGADLKNLLGKFNVDVLCHGHRHHPYVKTEFVDGWKAPVTILCAGSLSVNSKERNKGMIPNLFHILTLENRDSTSNAAIGTVKTYEYIAEGWVFLRSQIGPLDSYKKFGSLAGKGEKESSVKVLFDTAIKKNAENCELPNFKDLDLGLQCMSREELNKLIFKVASESNFRVIGKYPESVYIIRNKS